MEIELLFASLRCELNVEAISCFPLASLPSVLFVVVGHEYAAGVEGAHAAAFLAFQGSRLVREVL